jgi:hypothetical protein
MAGKKEHKKPRTGGSRSGPPNSAMHGSYVIWCSVIKKGRRTGSAPWLRSHDACARVRVNMGGSRIKNSLATS